MKGYQALPEERCGNCKYFRKHYIRAYKGCYTATNYGHCLHPRLKNRRAEERCPPFYAPGGVTKNSLRAAARGLFAQKASRSVPAPAQKDGG